jgi:Leucine rich repeat
LTLLAIKLVFELFATVETKSVSCETIEGYNWGGPVWSVKTCWMPTTTIDESNTMLSSYDNSIFGLRIINNDKTEFLPVRVAETYPNLEAYRVSRSLVNEMSKENFGRLYKLKYLSLSHNQIKKIFSDVFEDLVSLEKLFLSKTKNRF